MIRPLKALLVLVLTALFTACEKDNQDDPDMPNISNDSLRLAHQMNQFIHDCMSDMYLWNNEIPNLNPKEESDPKNYFKNTLVKQDKWSFITDNTQELLEELQGTEETFGYDLIYGQFSDTEQYFVTVKYIYPRSPSDRKLKRGDIILQINGKDINKDDLDKFNKPGTIDLTLGEMQGDTIYLTDKVIHLTSKKMELDPVLITNVIKRGNHKIGYLMYTSFIGKFNTSLEKAFNDFKAQGITDFVLDLRYNHGGDDLASTFMCSALAPKSVATKGALLSKEIWNTTRQSIFENDPKSQDKLYNYFDKVDCNLDLPNKRIFILTTGESASASEYTAICLKPFMNVTLIGSQTHGKYTTMYFYAPQHADKDGKYIVDEELKNWIIIPVCSRYTNINDYPNFLEGMTPAHEVEEDIFSGTRLGQANEPLLAKAIELITGRQATPKRKSLQATFKFKKIEQSLNDIRSNRIIINHR